MNLNKAFVLGNVTRDPEVRALPSGQQVTSFGVATNRFYTDQSGQKQQDAEFHNVVCFGKLADIASRYLNKGGLVFIEGRIKTRNWQNAQGIKQYRTEIIAETLQLGPKKYDGSGGGQYQKSFSPQENQSPNSSSSGEIIPVIDESAPPANFANIEEPKPDEEIDIKDIPF